MDHKSKLSYRLGNYHENYTAESTISMQLGQHNHEFCNTISKLQNLAASVFAISSPNVNWHNSSYTTKFKRPFSHDFQYAHLSATCSDIGKQGTYRNHSTLQGGNAIVTLGHWASRVAASYQDPRGNGSFTSTTFQGRNNRKLTIICANIAVPKGTDMGETSVSTIHHYGTDSNENE
jgi:hypothetical protein